MSASPVLEGFNDSKRTRGEGYSPRFLIRCFLWQRVLILKTRINLKISLKFTPIGSNEKEEIKQHTAKKSRKHLFLRHRVFCLVFYAKKKMPDSYSGILLIFMFFNKGVIGSSANR